MRASSENMTRVFIIASYLFKVSAAASGCSASGSFVVGVVLILPLVEVDLEPVLFRLVLEQSLPVGTLLLLFQGEFDHAIPNSELGFLEKLIQKKLVKKILHKQFSNKINL